MTAWRRLAMGFASIASLVLMTDALLAQSAAFTDRQLAEAKVYISTMMDPKRLAELEAEARKSGRRPEHVFLANQSFWRKVGSGSGDVNVPAKGSDKDIPQGQAESGDVDFLPKEKKKRP